MRTLLLSILAFLFFIECYSQGKRQKLLVAEYKIDTPQIGNFTYLVAYNFDNGILISKDTIIGAPTSKQGEYGSYVRFDLGRSFIYKKRYVISGTGNVIDIEKKRLVIEESDDFVSATGDTLIFHRANIITGTGYLMLNLKTEEYNFINHDEINRDTIGRTSPDKKHYLRIDRSQIPYKIYLHDAAGDKTIIVHDAGDGPIISGGRIPTIETYWLNDSLFLYAAHKIGAIDRSDFDSSELSYLKFYSTITLHQLNINTKEDKVFFVLDSVKQGNMNGRFFKDKIGQTVYRTSGFDSYLIDTDRKTLLEYPFYELGNGFSVANKSDSVGKLIRYYGKEIGKKNPSVEHVSKGIIALDQNSKAISVWSAVTGEWSTIKIPWISSVVGWIDEE